MHPSVLQEVDNHILVPLACSFPFSGYFPVTFDDKDTMKEIQGKYITGIKKGT